MYKLRRTSTQEPGPGTISRKTSWGLKQFYSRKTSPIYSRLSLSRSRLSRITAYLEVKIGSLFKHGTPTTGNKILWKRGKIAPKEQFLLFSTIFAINLKLQESNYILIRGIWLFDLFFAQFCRSDMSRYGYLKVFQGVPRLRDNESIYNLLYMQ